MIIPKLATVSSRSGVTQEKAEAIYVGVMAMMDSLAVSNINIIFKDAPWAFITVDDYVIGQGKNHNYMTVFKVPFEGHADDWQVIKPIHTADDLLEQLRGSSNES